MGELRAIWTTAMSLETSEVGSPSNFPRYSKQRHAFRLDTSAVFTKFPEPRVKSDGLDCRTGS